MKYFLSLIKSIDKTLLLIPLFFAGISMTVITSITYTDGSYLTRDTLIQGLAFLFGYFAIFVIILFDYKIIEKYEKIIYILALFLLLTVYTPLGIGNSAGTRWLDLGVLTIQPSEISRPMFIAVFAFFLARNHESLSSLKGVALSMLYAAPFLAIIAKEDLGSGLVLIVTCIAMVFYAGIDRKLFIRLAVVSLFLLVFLSRFLKTFQRERIDAFLHPDNLSIQATYHVFQAKVAIGSGGFWGKGLFSGTQKELNFLPVQESDFIFAVTAEELGFIGASAIIVLYLMFLLRMWRGISRAKDRQGALMVVGIMTAFTFQVFENIGMNMGIMPVTGIPLPLISAGGTAVVANMIALGLVLNVGIRNKTFIFSNQV